MHPRELEQIVGGRLRRLPLPRAPETLLPRVLAAVQAWAQRPWYARAWFTWPAPLQLGSVIALVLLFLLTALILPAVQTMALGIFGGPVAAAATYLSAAWQGAAAATQTVRVLWRALAEPIAPYVFVVVVAMCLACGAFVTVISCVAIAGDAHR